MKMIDISYKIFLSIFIIFILIKLPNNLLWDRDNYLYYAEYSNRIIENYNDIFSLIFNDYLFLKINYFLSYFIKPEIIVSSFVILSLSILFYLLSKYSTNFLTFTIGVFLSILITPILHLEIIAIRQALATSIVLIGLYIFKDFRKIILVFLFASLIHSAFFLFMFLFFLDNLIFSKFKFNKRIFLNSIIILLIAFSYLIIAALLGLRQVELYSSYDGAVGGGSFLIACCVFIYLYFYGETPHKLLYFFVIQGFILFIVFYFFANASVSARLLESIYPAFLLILVSKFRDKEVLIILLLILAYGFVWYNGGVYILFEVSNIEAKNYLMNII